MRDIAIRAKRSDTCTHSRDSGGRINSGARPTVERNLQNATLSCKQLGESEISICNWNDYVLAQLVLANHPFDYFIRQDGVALMTLCRRPPACANLDYLIPVFMHVRIFSRLGLVPNVSWKDIYLQIKRLGWTPDRTFNSNEIIILLQAKNCTEIIFRIQKVLGNQKNLFFPLFFISTGR